MLAEARRFGEAGEAEDLASIPEQEEPFGASSQRFLSIGHPRYLAPIH